MTLTLIFVIYSDLDEKYKKRDRYSGMLQDFKEKDGYKPEFKLEYVDDLDIVILLFTVILTKSMRRGIDTVVCYRTLRRKTATSQSLN